MPNSRQRLQTYTWFPSPAFHGAMWDRCLYPARPRWWQHRSLLVGWSCWYWLCSSPRATVIQPEPLGLAPAADQRAAHAEDCSSPPPRRPSHHYAVYGVFNSLTRRSSPARCQDPMLWPVLWLSRRRRSPRPAARRPAGATSACSDSVSGASHRPGAVRRGNVDSEPGGLRRRRHRRGCGGGLVFRGALVAAGSLPHRRLLVQRCWPASSWAPTSGCPCPSSGSALPLPSHPLHNVMMVLGSWWAGLPSPCRCGR